jgi:hypothetical protein
MAQLTFPDTHAFRAGAVAVRNAIRQIPETVGGDPDQSNDEYLDRRDNAILSILAAAGQLPDHAAGALAAVAELLVWQEQNGGTPRLEQWNGEMGLTSEQRQIMREIQFARIDEEMTPKAISNVIELRQR